MLEFKSLFQPIIGKICWNVKQGFGSFLTFEFGTSHNKIIARHPSNQGKQNKKDETQRTITFGDWHLWIKSCDWVLHKNGKLVGDSGSSKKVMKQVVDGLNGLALERVLVEDHAITIFYFNQGWTLETKPYSRGNNGLDDLWLLYEPSGMVFILRSDGKYIHTESNHPRPDEWFPIIISE
jgi:hypothetical protein